MKSDKNIKELFTITTPSKQQPYYEIRIEADMNDADYVEKTSRYSVEEWNCQDEEFFLALILAFETEDIRDLSQSLQNLLYNNRLVPYDSEGDYYAHTLTSFYIVYYDEDSREYGVKIPGLLEVFDSMGEFAKAVEKCGK